MSGRNHGDLVIKSPYLKLLLKFLAIFSANPLSLELWVKSPSKAGLIVWVELNTFSESHLISKVLKSVNSSDP
jgi:hypothetical protein